MVDGAQEFQTKLMQAAQGATATTAAAVDAATAAAAPANAIAPIVDFDAGGNWGGETIVLDHPFKLKGVTYSAVTMRIPTGLDITRFYAASPRPTMVDFAISLTSVDGAPIDRLVFGAMHGVDAGTLVTKSIDFFGQAR
ncbi:phage tail assembly protein [Methylosinus sp. H3A]|uniref:phage tail assembly protein n=1 Tax=Methylosinus sp. H3A TaxID=2785786 RepID=UPI0018C263F7|nr:phage tail assembly protein [Methylosinus sp. H3A]MBG0809839.1 phage tail assembly protein [Methylosinus sp. H3A]